MLPIINLEQGEEIMTDTNETSTIAADKNAVFDILNELGIDRITVTFDGYGDSGQIESIEVFADGEKPAVLPDNRLVTFHGEETRLREAIETLAYDCLEASEPGWENNEGAYGTFVFAVADRTIVLEHNARVSDVATSHHSF
jgi:hypothetical protein